MKSFEKRSSFELGKAHRLARANYMKEMNGETRVESNGPGKGATFTLSFPKNAKKTIIRSKK